MTMKIEISLNGVTYDNDFVKDVSVDRTCLDKEFEDFAGRYAFYLYMLAEAAYQESVKKQVADSVYASLDIEKRSDLTKALTMSAGKGTKPTEKMVENEVILDQRYKDAADAHLKASKLHKQLEGAVRAMAAKKDMLMQIGAANRATATPTRVLGAQEDHVRNIIANNNK